MLMMLAQGARPLVRADDRWTIIRGAVALFVAITGIVYNVLLVPA